MKTPLVDQIAEALNRKQRKAAIPLLGVLQSSDARAFSTLCLRFQLHDAPEFWRQVPVAVLLALADVEGYTYPLRRAYLKQAWGKRGTFHGAVTARFLENDPGGMLEAIRTTRAFLNERFYATFPKEAPVCAQPDVKGVLAGFEEMRGWYQGYVLPAKERIHALHKKLQLHFFEFLCLAAIYYEEALHRQHFHPEEKLPLRLPIIQEAINNIVLRFPEKGRDEEIVDLASGTQAYLKILDRASKDEDYWKEFQHLMLMEMGRISLQRSLEYFCTYGATISMQKGGIHQSMPFTFEDASEKNHLRNAMELQVIPLAYENIAKAIQWRKEKAQSPKRNGFNAAAIYEWEFAGFPKQVRVGAKVIHAHFLLDFHVRLQEGFDYPMKFYRQRFYQFLKDHPELGPLGFPAQYAAYTALFAKQNDMSVLTPLSMMPLDVLRAKVDEMSPDARVSRSIMDSVSLLVRDGHKDKMDIYDQPMFRFGEMLCFFGFTIPVSGQSGSLQNLVLKSWKRHGEESRTNARSHDFEMVVVEILHKAGFGTAHRFLVKDNGRPVTDMDIVAWRGNEFLIIEVKSTYHRSTLSSNFEFRNKLEEAGMQLDKAIGWARAHSREFLDGLGCGKDILEPRFHGLIITTSQEGNGERWGEGQHLKTSIFDFIQLVCNVKVPWQCFLSKAFSSVAGSDDEKADYVASLLQKGTIEEIRAVGLEVERNQKELYEKLLPELAIRTKGEVLTPERILQDLEERVIWAEWDREVLVPLLGDCVAAAFKRAWPSQIG